MPCELVALIFGASGNVWTELHVKVNRCYSHNCADSVRREETDSELVLLLFHVQRLCSDEQTSLLNNPSCSLLSKGHVVMFATATLQGPSAFLP